MTSVYITIDTEYSASMAAERGLDCRAENYACSIAGETPDGPTGIPYQLDLFNRHGLKAVFFVDPMPALVWGVAAIEDVVGPIISAGHDVQLHLHAEWLELAGHANPLGGRTGRNIADFNLDEQCRLIDFARRTLVAAGAPDPIAFRAGNYGANDDTLRALAELGIRYDSSHVPGIADSECAISLGSHQRRPLRHCGVIEVPVGCIESFGRELRHAQITALSAREMLSAVRHARKQGIGSFTFVSHSFELLCRKRVKVNRIVARRFERLCGGLAKMDGVASATYADDPPIVRSQARASRPVLPHDPLRAGIRVAEQAVSNALYGQ